MNNSINAMNNVNFGAKMNISRVKTNKARWENIAKMFEEQTAKQPDITYNIVEPKQLKGIAVEAEGKKGKFYHTDYMVYGEFFDETYDKLMQLADKTIVSKFKKLMNLAVKNDNIYKQTKQIEKDKKLNELDAEKLWDDVVGKAYDNTQNIISKDSFLKDTFVEIA